MDINSEKDCSEIYNTLSMLKGNEKIISFIIEQINNVTVMKTHLTIKQYETDGFVINMKGIGNKENDVKNIGYFAVIDKDSYHIISYLIIAIKYFEINTLNNNVNLRFIFSFSSTQDNLIKKSKCTAHIDYLYYIPSSIQFVLGASNKESNGVMVNREIFTINVIGKSGHSSIPYYCKNPIAIGSKIITEISSIHSQKINPYTEKYIMGISDFNGGTAFNAIPDSAIIRGYIETTDSSLKDKLVNEIQRICRNNINDDHIKVDFSSYSINTIDFNNSIILGKDKLNKYFSLNKVSNDIMKVISNNKGMMLFLGNKADSVNEDTELLINIISNSK